jgi:hypothetical protein
MLKKQVINIIGELKNDKVKMKIINVLYLTITEQ